MRGATASGRLRAGAEEGGRALESRGRRGEAFKRRAYMFILALIILLLVGQTVANGLDVPYWGIAQPSLAGYDVVVLIAIWRRRVSLRASEALLLVPLVVALFGYLVAWRVAPTLMTAESTDVVLVMLWAGVAFPLCFLLFGTRRGLQASVAIYAVFLLLVAPPLLSGDIPEGASGSTTSIALSLAAFFAVMIALLAVLASRFEELAAARAEARLFAAQAITDPLTGLPNRRQLDDELHRQVAVAERYAQAISVVLVDIDHFKVVNDQLGHDAGDRALVELAGRLTESVRRSDRAGRWGGEEFLMILPHTDHEAACQLAERCRARIADVPFAGVGRVTASLGVATLDGGDDARSVLNRADLALYTAKSTARDRVVGLCGSSPSADAGWAGQPVAPDGETQRGSGAGGIRTRRPRRGG